MNSSFQILLFLQSLNISSFSGLETLQYEIPSSSVFPQYYTAPHTRNSHNSSLHTQTTYSPSSKHLIYLSRYSSDHTPCSSAPAQRFNCPNEPPPIGLNRFTWPSLYRFCVSPAAHCDCHVEDLVGHPNVYSPRCLEDGRANPHDLYHELAIHDCRTTCTCSGGPLSNWISWPNGPPPRGPRVPTPNLQNLRVPIPGFEQGLQPVT